MLIRYRRWCLGLTLLCGSVIVQQNSDNKLYAQGNPLPAPMPVPTLPGGYAAPVPGGTAVPGVTNYSGGLNSDKAPVLQFKAPSLMPEERALPINLAAALRLANAQAWDVGIASQQIRVAAAQLTQANVLWLPTIAAGLDYTHHDGSLQEINGTLAPVNKNAIELGGSPEMVFATTEAIFEPLAARQIMKARKADLQTTTNDITFNVAKAYFDVQQARGNLSGAVDTIQRTRLLVKRIEAMAPDLVPQVEVARARAQLAKFEQDEQTAREQWNVASAELVRITRLDPSAVVIPLEPPHLQVTLVSPEQPLDNLLPVALSARPELVSFQALTQAALKRWREEQFRPLLPSVYMRGGNGELPDSMMFGGFTGGPNGTFGNLRPRVDYELQVMWELRNMGFGNAAAMKQRRAEYDVTRMQAYRLQDFVAREVAQAYAQVRSARARELRAEVELREAEISASQNFEGLGTVKRLGNIIIPVIRPQEAVVAMTALLQAYYDYYGTVADYNRTQFQLYRALGNPAQALPMLDPNNPDSNGTTNPNPSPPPPAAPPAPNAAPATIPGAPTAGNSVDPAGVAATSASVAMPKGPPVESASASMLVRVPANADVYCDGIKMTLTGSERNFVSPPLPPGRIYPYEIRVHYVGADGKPIEQTRQVQVQAGQKTTVDFLSHNP